MKNSTKNSFRSLKKFEIRKEGNSLLRNPFFKVAVMIVCIIVDVASLFTLFDRLLNENEILLIAVVLSVSVSLVVFPVFLANYVNTLPIPKKNVVRMTIIISGTGFFILFLSTFIARWNGRYTLFDTATTSNNTTYYADLSSVSSAGSPAADMSSCENSVAILLGALPLINATLCFLLHFFTDAKRSRIHTLRLQQIDLRERISETSVFISILEHELSNHELRATEEEKYKTALEKNKLITNYCKIVARRILAEELQTPEATTLLLEETQLKERISLLLTSDSPKYDY